MTEENCNTYNWTADKKDDKPVNQQQRVAALIRSFIRWLTGLMKILTGKLFAA